MSEPGKLVFTFPGQGGYRPEVLRALHDRFPFGNEFTSANKAARQILGHEFLPLVTANSAAERERILGACPELDQLAIYVTNFLMGSHLIASGLRPDALLGHSFGELAALAIGGVYSFETGLRIVCQRSAVLRQIGNSGGNLAKMAAITCGADRAAELLHAFARPSLSIAVVNSTRQTVISGLADDLDALVPVLGAQGIGLTILQSRYPFHSSLLRAAVEPFRLILCSYTFQPPAIPVYLCTERKFLSGDVDLSAALSEQFVKILRFGGLLRDLHGSGYRRFVECGAGNIVTKITSDAGLEGVVARATAPSADGIEERCDAIRREFGADKPVPANPDTNPAMELGSLVEEMRAVLERANRVLAEKSAPIAIPAVASEPHPEPDVDVDAASEEPIAIVSMGCVLPGAHNPGQYWNNVLRGVSGIADLAKEDPTAGRDFLAGDDKKIVSDKTYTLLHGSAGKLSYDASVLAPAYSEASFRALTRVEQLLALALGQALAGSKTKLADIPAERVECILGATADGSTDYDYSVFAESVDRMLEEVEPDSAVRADFSAKLRTVWTNRPGEPARHPQFESYRNLVQSMAGRAVRTYVIDAACSSSLYAIGLGFRSLREHSTDLMLVGGAFAPAMANSALFAQFRGLSPNGSRPLDKNADGVIFGEGSGILVLKRLSDALSAGDRVLGVIRGVGLSSDGKSPAINVPQSRGQSMAIRRAYEASGIDVNSIQYVEAHATATPVGDAVEFEALRQAIRRDPGLPKVELGSVKALLGHTGWAAGVASVIKLCKAFENRTVPAQYNFTAPSPEIHLHESPFVISTEEKPWPANGNSLPRRAAINGFGFGGTNAHLILEEFDPAYHRKLVGKLPAPAVYPDRLAVIRVASLFPAVSGLEGPSPSGVKEFSRAAMRLPKGKMLLPDVTEHMDPGQFLALLAAERVLPALGEKLKQLRDSTGVVIGVESKTAQGIRANLRIFLDRLKRLFEESRPDAQSAAILEKLSIAIRKRVLPSGPYTLAGLMPNVISGRVANMYDLNGPNVVIDMGENSLFQSLLVARDFLAHGDCKAVLAGGLNAVRMSGDDGEAVFLALVTTEATAKELDLPVSCLLNLDKSNGQPARTKADGSYRGAQGILEISSAIAEAAESKREARLVGRSAPLPHAPAPAASPVSSSHAYVQGTPISCYTPVETAAPLPALAGPHKTRKFLFLIDQPERWKQVEESGALAGIEYHVLSARTAASTNSTAIDLADEESTSRALSSIALPFDTIVPVKFLSGSNADTILTAPSESGVALADLLFAVSRTCYEGLRAGKLAMASVCLGAYSGGRLNPISGLFAGFVKSLQRELPGAVCRSLNIAESDFGEALRLVAAELAHPGQPVEVCYRAGARSAIELALVQRISTGDAPQLDRSSVVLATGGGRGVTAVLVEELLSSFGCTVIAVGRTDPASAPPELLRMDAAQLAAYEPEFYRAGMAAGGKKITELRNQFRAYQAAHEVHEIVERLGKLPGRFEYISADITDGPAMAAIVESIFARYGRVDLVLHGAGVQISKVLTKKSIGDFESVIRAKLASLQTIYAVCEKRRAGKPLHYHLLTSAFSYMGNDGQPDYGAVNEALNRLADAMAAKASGGGSWCSVAWLGWAGIGMTRGSEFAALAASRGLRGITGSEGREIFAQFLRGEVAAPINILMAEGERKFYNVATTPAPFERAASAPVRREKENSVILERTIDLAAAPFVTNHRVDGVPTLPGAFLIMMVAEAALELRPDLKITAFEDAVFRRFVRLREDGPTHLRLKTSVETEDESSSLIRVQVVSDFTHKNGMVLQKDVVQTEISVRMAAVVERARRSQGTAPRPEGRLLRDPYVMEGSPIQLNGPFRTLNNILVGEDRRSAEYCPLEKVTGGSGYHAFLPNLLVMDSLWRFGAIDMDAQNAFPVYVPEACKVMKVYYDLSNPDAPQLTKGLQMTGFNPTEDRDRLTIGPVEVRDASGSVLLTVDGGICRRMGEVRHERR